MFVKQMLPRARERLAVIEAEAPVREAAYLMSKPNTDLVVVCSHGDMVGVVTKLDIVSQISRCTGFGCITRVESVTTRDVTYCRASELLRDVWSVTKERGLQRIPVLDGARSPIRVIYTRDALQTLLGEAESEDELLRDYIAGVGY
jgi:CBS domain-containing protein